jgi:tRNA threonylcarbamoyladenosine biosynthesis protein TsaB
MRVLGVDSASSYPSAAVIEEGQLLSETIHRPSSCSGSAAVGSRNDHSENLLPLIDQALRASALTLHDIDGYAVAIGPGSFTGLRVGLSTIMGLAYGSSIPVAGISTLHAIAARAVELSGIVCPILDARKNELYAALFRSNGRTVERLRDDALLSCESLVELIRESDPADPVWVADSSAAVYRLIELLGSHARIVEGDCRPTIAASVARLGEADLARGNKPSPTILVPRYVSPPRVELPSENLSNILKLHKESHIDKKNGVR